MSEQTKFIVLDNRRNSFDLHTSSHEILVFVRLASKENASVCN